MFDGRIYSLGMYVDDTFPFTRPQIRFISKVSLPFVEPNGVVNPAKLGILAQWRPEVTL